VKWKAPVPLILLIMQVILPVETDTGGLVGKLNTTQDATYTTNIKNAYNGDNNTVIREDLGTIPRCSNKYSGSNL
jgi:hypothetical protein